MNCPICKKTHKNKRFCSNRCYWESLRGLKNEKAPNWRGDRVGKSEVHVWLNVNYGKIQSCENKSCKKKSVTFDWCLKTGMEYKKDRNNFLRLCRSCHKKYDLTDEKKQKYIENLYWKTGKKRVLKKTGEPYNEKKLD